MKKWARGEYAHHHITSNSSPSAAINTTPKPKPTANGSKIASARLHFNHQRQNGRCFPEIKQSDAPTLDLRSLVLVFVWV
jgi:hypothetical protein